MSLLPAETELDVKGRKLTGGMVLFMLLGFFATIIAVNMVLLGFAIRRSAGARPRTPTSQACRMIALWLRCAHRTRAAGLLMRN